MLSASTDNNTNQLQGEFPAVWLLLAWSGFLAYGSLMPFEFRAIPLDSLVLHILTLGNQKAVIRSFTDWATNIAIFVPIGFFATAAIGRSSKTVPTVLQALFVLGISVLLSVAVECTQAFFPPRDSSLRDIIANTIGAGLGIVSWLVVGDGFSKAYRALYNAHFSYIVPVPPMWLSLFLLGSCGLLIAGWGSFFTSSWTGWDAAITRLNDVHFFPFIEHQAATIGLALVSTLIAALVYAPLGAVLWLLNTGRHKNLGTRLMITASGVMGVATVAETAKLFLAATKPDTGNIVIAGLASALGYFIAPLAAKLFKRGQSDEKFDSGTSTSSHTLSQKKGFILGRVSSLLCAVAASALVATYPVGQIAFGLALFAYCAVLMRYPTAWLLVVPALMPVLDLAPWTGRFFFDEFDAVVLASLTVGLWRVAAHPLAGTSGRFFWLLVAGFTVSFLTSAVIGLLPLQALDTNALASYYSHYSALRMAKMLLFAVGLGVLLSSHVAAGHDVKRLFSKGMIIGLAAACVSVIWERMAYAGLTNFTQDFRVVGLFSTMNTGGSHLDAFLIAALPFAAAWFLGAKRWIVRFTAIVLFVAGTYSVMMTFSRAAVAALVTVVLLSAAWALISRRRETTHSLRVIGRMVIGLTAAALVIFPALLGPFMQSRFANTSADLGIRNSYWSDAVSMMTDNWRTTLFGMGLGRYPETYMLLSNAGAKPAVSRYETEGDNIFLRIHPGAPIYVEQIVAVEPHTDYKITLKARTQGGHAAINTLLCDRTFLHGYGCQSASFELKGEAGKWQQLEARLHSATVGQNWMRVAKLSLENAGSAQPIDFDDVSLIDVGNANHIANGNFQSGADRWYFSSPHNHIPWHIANLWLGMLFEQGWVGLVLFSALVTVAMARLAVLALRGKSFAATVFTSLAGFLIVGGFDSVFDAPRLVLLFGLFIIVPAVAYARPQPATSFATVNAATQIPQAIDWRRAVLPVLLGVLMLAGFIGLVTRLPFVPYNIQELPNPYHPLIAPLLLAAFFYWVLGLPASTAHWLIGAKRRGAMYPLLVIGHGLMAWFLLQFAVLPESIHDVIGSPVLNWPWQMEYIARFVPLLSVLAVQLTGGALIAFALTGRRAPVAAIWWLATAILLLPLQYWVIVSQAATDNLTELIANNASVGACLLLCAYLMLIGTAGSLIACPRAAASPSRISLALVFFLFSIPVGYLLLTTGTESVIVKEQKAFSALQFLLSTDRSNYATGYDLWLRFTVAHLGVVLLTALTQYPLWTSFQNKSPQLRK